MKGRAYFQIRQYTGRQRNDEDQQTDELRPALTDHKNLEDEIEETMTQRRPLYEGAMHFAIDTDDFELSKITQEILTKVKK